MKNLIDYIEECGEGCATPGNTMGMGNPMAPGAPGTPGMPGEPGTEPIGAAGPKKEKRNTSKRKKKVNEGIFNDEDTVAAVIDVIVFVKHMLSNGVELYGKKIDEKYAEELGSYLYKYNMMTFDKGEIVIDSEAFEKYAEARFSDQTAAYAYGLLFTSNGICINPKTMPKHIKAITYKQAKDNKSLTIKLVGDTNFSNVDIKCEGNLIIYTEKPSDIRLGKINCNELHICGYKRDILPLPTGLSLKPGSVINTVDLTSRTCSKIGKLVGRNLTIDKIKLNSSIIGCMLTNMGFATPNTYISISE